LADDSDREKRHGHPASSSSSSSSSGSASLSLDSESLSEAPSTEHLREHLSESLDGAEQAKRHVAEVVAAPHEGKNTKTSYMLFHPQYDMKVL